MEIIKPLAETAAEKLVAYVVEQNLESGAKLPNEFVLAQRLGVGRSTLREAVKMLVTRNVLEVRQGSGTFVKKKAIGVATDPLGLIFIKDKKKLAYDLLEIRINIEPRFASLAAVNRSEQDLVEFEQLCMKVEELIGVGMEYLEYDIAFHTKIAEMSHNIVAPTITSVICQAITVFIEVTGQKLKKETIDTHRMILDAIKEGDSTAAHDAMMMHLLYNRNEFRRVFK